jgi:hypothetical protein
LLRCLPNPNIYNHLFNISLVQKFEVSYTFEENIGIVDKLSFISFGKTSPQDVRINHQEWSESDDKRISNLVIESKRRLFNVRR